MSNKLKTVERASDLRTVQSQLNNIARDIEDFSSRLETVKHDVDKIYKRLEILHGNAEGGGDILDKAVRANERLKEQKADLVQKRESIFKQIETHGYEGENCDKTLSLVGELDNLNHDISELDVKIQTTDNLLGDAAELFDSEKDLTGKLNDNKALFSETQKKLAKVKRLGIKQIGGKVLRGAGGFAVGTVKRGLKSGITKTDPAGDGRPLSGGINKDDVADTGAESIRLARQSFGKVTSGIKTAKQAVKTTTRGIKTAAKATKQTVKGAYKTAVFVKNAVVAVGKFAVSAVMHIAAVITSSVFWIIAAVLLVVAMLSSAVILIMGGTGNQKSAMATGAAGLGNVSEVYIRGVEMRETAISNAKSEHNALVNVTGSDDLIYMSVTRADRTMVNYITAFAQPWQKDFLKSEPWTYPLRENLPPVNDTITIAYILLQKRVNEANGTTNQIYDVTFTEEIFNEVIGASVVYNSTIYADQLCAGQNCDYWVDDHGGIHYYCHRHTLYAIGVWYYSADTVMDTFEFTDYEKQWTELTKAGFESNPNITG